MPERIIHDVVVIGAGVAGALVARSLAEAGRKVALVEAGGGWRRDEAARRYRSAIERNLEAPYGQWPWLRVEGGASGGEYRPLYMRGIGGTTWHWTAITPRFLPEDFRMRSLYGVGRDWPIDYQTLEPWYVLAEKALGVAGDSRDDHGSPRSAPYPMPAIPMTHADQRLAARWRGLRVDGRPVRVAPLPAARNSRPYDDRPACRGNNTCTPICPIGASYSAEADVRRAVRAGAMLASRAVAWKFDLDGQRRLTAVHVRHPDGSRRVIRGRRFVIACNSIETPRLLLLAACEACPAGLANRSGQVGRNLMDHALVQKTFQCEEPLYIGRGPQSVSTVLLGRGGDFRRRHAAAKFFISNDLNIQRLATEVLKARDRWHDALPRLRRAAIHQGIIGAEIEQLPDPDNRVRLDEKRRDALGFAAARLEYRLGDYATRGAEHWDAVMDRLIREAGGRPTGGSFSLSSHHPAGTARMGENPRDSVVNADCRSHDHANLFIVGGSVFPTLGTANPTLTIAALALRLAAHLRALG